MFGFSGSFWLNALVAREVHLLMSKTSELAFYRPPSRRAVLCKCACMLGFVGFICSWHLWGVIPLRAMPIRGMACFPLDYNVESTIFFWVVFIPAAVAIPIVYNIYVLVLCLKYNLVKVRHIIPRRRGLSAGASEFGLSTEAMAQRARQERSLTLFFMRILISMVLLWVPAALLSLVLPIRSVTVAWFGGTLSHLQGIVSATLCLTKPDIAEATADLLRCGVLWGTQRVVVLAAKEPIQDLCPVGQDAEERGLPALLVPCDQGQRECI